MSTPQEGELNREELALFEQDLQDLRAAQEAHGTNLESRVQYGLDPAGMMALRDTAPQVGKIAEILGTTSDKVWPLIDELHTQGPWKLADRLAVMTEPEIQTYMVLAAACHEKGGRDTYTQSQYLEDRARVVRELGDFTPADLTARKQNIIDRIKNREDKVRRIGSKEVTVPVAEGDPALALAMQGHKGCVTKAGEMRFAQTVTIDDSILAKQGMVRGFAEMYDPALQGFKRVSLQEAPSGARVVWVAQEDAGKELSVMTPKAKRIGPGFVLTYANEALAVDLVAQALGR